MKIPATCTVDGGLWIPYHVHKKYLITNKSYKSSQSRNQDFFKGEGPKKKM